MSHGFTFREGTDDEAIFRAVIDYDEYRMPDRFEADEIVVDIGVHIGSFSHLAAERGAGLVFGFEADPANFEAASRNLARYGDRVRLSHRAVWRSDRAETTLHVDSTASQANRGGIGVFWQTTGQEVEALAFDDLIRHVTDGGRRRVRLLKIDCEGSEFPILLTSRTLHLIDAISGEFHEFSGEFDNAVIPEHGRIPGFDRFTIDALTRVLEESGFEVESSRFGASSFGLFFARRSTSPPSLSSRLRNAWRRLAG